MNESLRAVYQVPAQRLFNIADAAKYLGVHPQTLRKWSDLGDVPCKRVGKQRMFILDDLDKWIETQPKWVSNGRS
jgi:excisionase family DNA binding protein